MISFKDINDVPNNFTGCYVNRQYNEIVYRLNGKYHRLGGPAVLDPNGDKCFYLFGKPYSEIEYWCLPLVVDYKLNQILEL